MWDIAIGHSAFDLLKPSAAATGSTVGGTDFWRFVERASWVVTVVGIIAVVWQLMVSVAEQRHIAAEQKRIADDALKRPEIIVGFAQGAALADSPPRLPTSCEIAPTWSTGEALSHPVDLQIVLFNKGQRSGHHALVNITFPPGIDAPWRALTIGSLHLQSERDPQGNVRVFAEQETHHPGVAVSMTVPVRVPRDTADFPGMARVHVDDTLPVTTRLQVVVR